MLLCIIKAFQNAVFPRILNMQSVDMIKVLIGVVSHFFGFIFIFNLFKFEK